MCVLLAAMLIGVRKGTLAYCRVEQAAAAAAAAPLHIFATCTAAIVHETCLRLRQEILSQVVVYPYTCDSCSCAIDVRDPRPRRPSVGTFALLPPHLLPDHVSSDLVPCN